MGAGCKMCKFYVNLYILAILSLINCLFNSYHRVCVIHCIVYTELAIDVVVGY